MLMFDAYLMVYIAWIIYSADKANNLRMSNLSLAL